VTPKETDDEWQTFQVGDMDYNHEIGNDKCSKGWCDGGSNYPDQCDCGGLIHADFGDENCDCDYWLYRKCDRCGED
jgi:hypothetical protein